VPFSACCYRCDNPIEGRKVRFKVKMCLKPYEDADRHKGNKDFGTSRS
jgi:hypothetical protein